MTLSTDVYIHGEVNSIDALWSMILAGLMDEAPEFHSLPIVKERAPYSGEHTVRETIPAQGLPAWTALHYTDGPLQGTDQPAWEEDEGEPEPPTIPAHHYRVNWDTGYAYRDDKGGCEALHARLIFALGSYLESLGVTWSWQNEFTGEIFPGYEGLESFIGDGEKARDWYREVVVPAMQAEGFNVT